MSLMAPIELLPIPGRIDPPLCVPSQDFFHAHLGFFLPSLGARVRGVSNMYGLLSFLRLAVIKGYGYKIELF